jgi:hypothetical protein
MRCAVLDSGAYDTIIDTPGAYATALAAVKSGGFELLYTHVNADELSRTGDRDRRNRLLFAMRTLGRPVPTGVLVLDRSRLDSARLAADGDPDLINSLRSPGILRHRNPDEPLGNPRHTNDELLAATARLENCALVVRAEGDERLQRRQAERACRAPSSRRRRAR